jgi:hypothetical protein
MNTRLQQYLDELEQPLRRRLPEETRREWRVEAEQHLESIVAAHEELGVPAEAAIEAAVRQFGDAGVIARDIRRETRRVIGDGSGWQATGRALGLLGAPLAAAIVVMSGVAFYFVAHDGMQYAILQETAGASFLLVPIIGGWRLGARLPWWRVDERVYGGARPRFDYAPIPGLSRRGRHRDTDFLPWLAFAALQYVTTGSVLYALAFSPDPPHPDWIAGLCWLPLAAASAWAGSRWSRWRHRVRRERVAAR